MTGGAAYGVVVAPEGEVDPVLEQQVLQVAPQLSRHRLVGRVALVAAISRQPTTTLATVYSWIYIDR